MPKKKCTLHKISSSCNQNSFQKYMTRVKTTSEVLKEAWVENSDFQEGTKLSTQEGEGWDGRVSELTQQKKGSEMLNYKWDKF
jgi:hypothetical protein